MCTQYIIVVCFVGMGTIYLPFFADRDKVRGLHEESELSSTERAEYKRAMKEMGHLPLDDAADEQQQRPGRASNSMWSRMNQAAAGQQK
jgi:hypothetical protein